MIRGKARTVREAGITRLLEANGSTEETAGGVARLVCNLDEAELLAVN